MSYPEPRYHGDGGEVSATIRRASEPPELPYHSGNAVHYLATEGSMYCGEVLSPNAGAVI